MKPFERLESEVRSYCRSFPTIFTRAQAWQLWDEKGRSYIDFFSGAGALNYGHNHPRLKQRLVDYLQQDGVTHSLDMATAAKRELLLTFEETVLRPRHMKYKVMFPGPTGTNAVEAALKIARTVTGRSNVIAFTNAFHGMTLGSLALTGNAGKRSAAGVNLADVARMPYHGYLGRDVDTIDILEQHLQDTSSGIDLPAALVLETIQAEGGVNVASNPWMRRLSKLLRQFEILLIIDDIQVGCGRTGPFFSFEQAEIQPDIICLSKSLSGYGLPLSLTLLKPELDQFEPGKHNGTFRGNNLAFVTATAALKEFWRTDALTRNVDEHSRLIHPQLTSLADEWGAVVRGRGMIYGVEFPEPTMAASVSRQAFRDGLLIETAGPQDQVLKFLPPLTISQQALQEGLDIVKNSAREVLERPSSTSTVAQK